MMLTIASLYMLTFSTYFLFALYNENLSNEIKDHEVIPSISTSNPKFLISLCGLLSLYSFIMLIFFVGKMLLKYLYFSGKNITFYEHFKKRWLKFPWKNPHDL
jgi:hypothetical protein